MKSLVGPKLTGIDMKAAIAVRMPKKAKTKMLKPKGTRQRSKMEDTQMTKTGRNKLPQFEGDVQGGGHPSGGGAMEEGRYIEGDDIEGGEHPSGG
jgi:hypothetical protein